MFASRKQVTELSKELQRMRLIVDRLRRDVSRVQGQLRGLEGWSDDFIKTQEVFEAETRAFVRPVAVAAGAPLASSVESCASSAEQEPAPNSSIRRLA
jgi:hypothetical protein